MHTTPITIHPAAPPTTDLLQAEVDQVHAELGRADEKAATLLGLFGAVLAGVVALVTTVDLPGAAVVALLIAAVPISASVVLLIDALRPRLNFAARDGFIFYAQLAGRPTSVLKALSGDPVELHATRLTVLSEIAVTKYLRISRAVRLLVIGLAVLALAVLLTVVL